MKHVLSILTIFAFGIGQTSTAQYDPTSLAKIGACTLGVICVGVPLYRMGNKCSHAARVMRNEKSDSYSKTQSILSNVSNVVSQVCTVSEICLKIMGTAVIGTAVYIVKTSLEGRANNDADIKDDKEGVLRDL